MDRNDTNFMLVNGNNNDSEGKETTVLLTKCLTEGRIDVLRSILDQIGKKPNFHEIVDAPCTENGDTLLHVAVKIESLDAIRTLLAAGVNPCVQNDLSKTAYHCVKNESVKTAFIQHFIQSAAHSKLGRVCQLLSVGLDVDSVDSEAANTALHYAASFGNQDVVRTLIDAGANPNKANSKGETALHDAVSRGDEDMVRLLLRFGADPLVANSLGRHCFHLAQTKPNVLKTLSLYSVQKGVVERSASVESELDRASVISSESFLLTSPVQKVVRNRQEPESWTDLLWPQPRYLKLDTNGKLWQFPKDGKLKVYFQSASDGEPRRLMQILSLYAPLLAGCQLDFEFRGHRPVELSPLEGKLTCGLFDQSETAGSYTLSVEENGVEIFGGDYLGVKHGMATFVQAIRLHRQNSTETEPGLPCVAVRDKPHMSIRAVFMDFSGCRTLTIDTLLSLATRLGYCKASHLFVNFEVRTTDRYQLPYTNRELFHLSQVCDELFVQFVPSIDLNSNYIHSSKAKSFVDNFLDDFPLSKVAHFGPNLASILLNDRPLLNYVQKRAKRIYLSVDLQHCSKTDELKWLDTLPPFVTLCVEGKYPLDIGAVLSPKVNVVLRFSTSDVGYLCQAQENTVKNAILAARLGDKFPINGTLVCELASGCEIMPPSLSYIPEMAIIGVSWNRQTDIKKFCHLLPRIAAQHLLLDKNMTALFEQALTLARVEHDISRFAAGILTMTNDNNNTADQWNSISAPSKTSPPPPPLISVFVEMILNPDNMILDRLTPVSFKKARVELRRSQRGLLEARKALPYNFELALVLAEMELVTELMVLAARIGQSLCIHGANPAPAAPLGSPILNVGLANLPLTVRTDLANTLLEIRSKFQHTWLSRNIPSTLPNALKIFDNLFRVLLPAAMQEYGQNLL